MRVSLIYQPILKAVIAVFFLLAPACGFAGTVSVGALTYVGKEPPVKPEKSAAGTVLSVGGLGYAGKEPPANPEKSAAGSVLSVGGLSYIGGKETKKSAPTPVFQPVQNNKPDNKDDTVQPTPMMNQGKTRKGSAAADGYVLNIKLVSSKESGGTSPFSTKTIRTVFGAKQEKERSPAGAAPPAPASSEPSAPAALRRSAGAPVSSAGVAGFSCAGKADGNYCQDENTQVFCYHESQASSQNCPSGCDMGKGICNSYKP